MIKRGDDMNISAKADKVKSGAVTLRMTAYLLAVTLVFSAVSILCNPETVIVRAPERGVLDLTGMDFSKRTVTIAEESFTMYPGAFYFPEEFATSGVTQAGNRYDSPGKGLGDYGTLRLALRLPPGEVYAVSGRSVSYAQRLFIDGKENPSIGRPGTSADAVTPKSMRYMEPFAVTGDTTEIVIHYSAFVHADGGGVYPLELGPVRNVVRTGQLEIFRAAAVIFSLITAMLFFFGLFLFFGKSRYFLWFSLACVCIALRSLLTGSKEILLLLPDLDWYLVIRLEYLTTCGTALFSALYLSALFPGAADKWVMRGYSLFCALYMAFVCLTLPLTFTRYAAVIAWAYVLFSAWLLAAVLINVLHKKRVASLSPAEQLLLLAGFIIYLLLSALGIHAHRYNTYLWGLDYPQVGMMVFLFINILTLALGFARTERELDEARRSEREMEETNRTLERLNRVKSNFLDNINHEMRTPLTIIGNYADTTIRQIRKNAVDAGTVKNLGAIQQEVQWLSRLVEQSKNESLEKEWRLTFADTNAEALLSRAANSCAAVCMEKGNRIAVQAEPGMIPLRVDLDGLYRVLFNLVINANRYTRNGLIAINAELKDNKVVFTVSDTGTGIAPELLPRVFQRGVSGDGGSGLGLAICKEIVEQHGGNIDIQSAGGKGTAVRFTLPSAKEGDKE